MAWAPSRSSCNARAGDDAAEAEFFPVEHLPHLAFDHLKASEREIMLASKREIMRAKTHFLRELLCLLALCVCLFVIRIAFVLGACPEKVCYPKGERVSERGSYT